MTENTTTILAFLSLEKYKDLQMHNETSCIKDVSI